jgi:hypothetical protein
LTQYFERIRDAKFTFDRMLRNVNNSFDNSFNNTLYRANVAGAESPSNFNKTNDSIHPFRIFDSEQVQDLSIINQFIIGKAYKHLTDKLETSITDSISAFKLIYIVILCIYFASMLILYLFIWRPFENNLNQTVHMFNFRFIRLKICSLLFLKRYLLLLVIFTSY